MSAEVEQKVKDIALRHDLVRISDYHYRVHSQTTNREYDVIKVGNKWECNCPDHVYRHVCCKHSHAVEFSLKIKEEVRKQNQITIEPITVSVCSHCKSEKIVKHGIRHNKYGNIQRFSCKDCKNRFVMNLGFEKMGATPQSITSAMQVLNRDHIPP